MSDIARILDVNCNRAGEALRTVEEYARFALNSPAWSERAKRLRHRLAGAKAALEAGLPGGGRLSDSRDIAGDVGASLKTEAEASRPDAAAVAAAALRRCAEALRALSEFGKVVNAELAAGFEEMRYELYALEPLILSGSSLRDKLRRARLYVLVTASLSSADPLTTAREAVAGGADIVQMREKEMEDGEFYRLAADMAEVCRAGGALFLVNDRPHIAKLVDAAGIHGGQGDLPVNLSRRIVGHDRIVGRSTSAPEFAEKALADGADYIGVGPVYETATQIHREAVGLSYVKWAAEWGKLPFFAIGSINRATIDGVVDAGAKAVAICTAITRAKDVAREAWFYKSLLARGERRLIDGEDSP